MLKILYQQFFCYLNGGLMETYKDWTTTLLIYIHLVDTQLSPSDFRKNIFPLFYKVGLVGLKIESYEKYVWITFSPRKRLEGQMLEKAEIESTGLEFLLGQVRTWSLGNYPSVDMRRTNLEREILALKKVGWDEQLRCWRDLVMLKKELREALEEYHLILSAEGL